jgi:hypothetical protein
VQGVLRGGGGWGGGDAVLLTPGGALSTAVPVWRARYAPFGEGRPWMHNAHTTGNPTSSTGSFKFLGRLKAKINPRFYEVLSFFEERLALCID